MTDELTLQEAALAWAQGKRVEARPSFRDGGPWDTISRVGHKDSSHWPASILNEDVAYKFRLAPEPPAKKWRPWTPEEVPVLAWLRNKQLSQHRSVIIGVTDCGLVLCPFNGGDQNDMGTEPKDLLECQEHSIDNGKTWLPCGVEVDA